MQLMHESAGSPDVSPPLCTKARRGRWGRAAPAHASSRAAASLLATPDAGTHPLSVGRHEGAGSRVCHWTAVTEKRAYTVGFASSRPSALQNWVSSQARPLLNNRVCTNYYLRFLRPEVSECNTRTSQSM